MAFRPGSKIPQGRNYRFGKESPAEDAADVGPERAREGAEAPPKKKKGQNPFKKKARMKGAFGKHALPKGAMNLAMAMAMAGRRK